MSNTQNVTINGYEAVITVEPGDDMATYIVFPNLYTQPDQPVSLNVQPAVTIATIESLGAALLAALGYQPQ